MKLVVGNTCRQPRRSRASRSGPRGCKPSFEIASMCSTTRRISASSSSELQYKGRTRKPSSEGSKGEEETCRQPIGGKGRLHGVQEELARIVLLTSLVIRSVLLKVTRLVVGNTCRQPRRSRASRSKMKINGRKNGRDQHLITFQTI